MAGTVSLLDLIKGTSAARASVEFATATPATVATLQKAESLPVATVATVAVANPLNRDAQPERLHRLAKLAHCPIGFLERLHPDEVAEYAHHDDAEAMESLRHLADCKDCRERQTRRVTCVTCARYTPNILNPTAGMGQCRDGLCAGPVPPWPHAERYCQGWRAAA